MPENGRQHRGDRMVVFFGRCHPSNVIAVERLKSRWVMIWKLLSHPGNSHWKVAPSNEGWVVGEVAGADWPMGRLLLSSEAWLLRVGPAFKTAGGVCSPWGPCHRDSSRLESVNTGVPNTGTATLLTLYQRSTTWYPARFYSFLRWRYSRSNVSKILEKVENKIYETLHKISIWLAHKKLSLNTNKTVYIEFGNQVDSTPKNLDISIQGTKIKRLDSAKYLGIIFDSHMRWNEHIEYIYNKTKYLIFIFYKLSELMSTNTLRIVYYALFHSITSYGIIAWRGAYSNSKNLLNRLQIRLLKIINKNKFSDDKNPMNIDQIFTYESLSYHYEDLQTVYINSRSTTRKKNIQIPRRCLTISIKNSYIRAITQ